MLVAVGASVLPVGVLVGVLEASTEVLGAAEGADPFGDATSPFVPRPPNTACAMLALGAAASAAAEEPPDAVEPFISGAGDVGGAGGGADGGGAGGGTGGGACGGTGGCGVGGGDVLVLGSGPVAEDAATEVANDFVHSGASTSAVVSSVTGTS